MSTPASHPEIDERGEGWGCRPGDAQALFTAGTRICLIFKSQRFPDVPSTKLWTHLIAVSIQFEYNPDELATKISTKLVH